MAKPQISIPLDIEDVNVLKIEGSPNGDLQITLESSLNYGYCRKCGQKLTRANASNLRNQIEQERVVESCLVTLAFER